MVLRLWNDYNREEIHRIFSPSTTFTPQSGTWGLQGIVKIPDRPGDYVFYVSLGTEQSNHHFDESITRDGVLSWQSQPKQTLKSPVITDLIAHDERKNSIYLFLRANRKLKKKYTYLGTLGYLTHDFERQEPVYFQWQLLDWPAPDSVIREWVAATPQAPAWRNDPVALAVPTVLGSGPKKQAPAPDQGNLEMHIPAHDSSGGTTLNDALVASLLESPIYQAQKKRQGARAITDDRMTSIISVLLTRSGRVHQDALAAGAGIPILRIHSTLSAARRQLNLEGYTVLSTDVDRVTIVLDTDLLRQQFLEGMGE